jgi:hypothetical protein
MAAEDRVELLAKPTRLAGGARSMRRIPLPLAMALAFSLVAFPVAAARPETISEQVDDQFLDEFITEACGFDVWITLMGHTKTRVWTDEAGNLIRELFTISVRGTMSAGGTALRLVDSGSDMFIPLEGGGERVAIRGSLALLAAPGHGPLFGGAGRFMFQATPVLDEEGNPVLDEEGNPVIDFEVLADSGIRAEDLDTLCAVLAPPA